MLVPSQVNPSDSRQKDGYHIFRRWSELLHGTKGAAGSRRLVHFRGGRTRRIKSSSGEGTVAHTEEFAGWLAALEVSGVAPIPTPCSLSFAMLGIPAASRKTSSSALHEAHTLHGADAGISRIRLPVKPTRAVSPKSDAPPRPTSRPCRSTCNVGYSSGQAQKLTGGRVRSRSRCGNNETRYTEVLNGGGSGGRGLQRLGGHA